MKRKIAFWAVIFLVNAAIGIISVRTYQNMDARITGVEKQVKSIGSVESGTEIYDFLFMHRSKINAIQGHVDQLTRDALRESILLGNDGKYDYNNVLIKPQDLGKFLNYKVYARTSLLLEVPEELLNLNPGLQRTVTKTIEAPAEVIGRYVLMVSHTNDAELLSRETVSIMTPMGLMGKIFELKVLKYNATLLLDGSELSLKELYRNKGKDFSLFEISVLQAGETENVKALNFPFKIGESSELKIGDFVYINGRAGGGYTVARPGNVTALSVVYENDGHRTDSEKFGMSQAILPGDSGSPVIAFRDGKPELIGLLSAFIGSAGGNTVRSTAVKINIAVDEIKEKLGLDLRALQHGILNK